jgi:hypothetical protein
MCDENRMLKQVPADPVGKSGAEPAASDRTVSAQRPGRITEQFILSSLNFDGLVKSPEKSVFAICQSIKTVTYEAKNHKFRLFKGPSISKVKINYQYICFAG